MLSMNFKWMRIEKIGDTGKTDIYAVIAKDGDLQLGQIRWFGRWRKYAFFPAPDTVYEATCLNDIAESLIALMKLRRLSKMPTDSWDANGCGR